MDGNVPPGSSEPQDVIMTNAEDEAGNMFDEMLAEMAGEWGSQDPFMLQNEVLPENYIDPALFAQSLGMPNVFGASPSASASPTHQEEQAYPFAKTTIPVRPVGQAIVSTPVRQQASSSAASSDYSPSSTGLHTPSRRDRGHYGPARRRTGALSNFQPIAASPQRESAQANTGYSFEPIPEHQQGILSPGNYINEDIPEFKPRRVTPEPETKFHFPQNLGSPCLAADPGPIESVGGGFDSQGTEPGFSQEMEQLHNALQYSYEYPVASSAYTLGIAMLNPPPSQATVADASANQQSDNYIHVAHQNANEVTANALPNYVPVATPNTIVEANVTVPTANPTRGTPQNTMKPWAPGMSFEAEPDPERRAKMLQIASVSHMLLTPKSTAFAATKAKVLQAGKAADEKMRNEAKKQAKRARKNANNTQNPALPATVNQPASAQQLGSMNQTAPPSATQLTSTSQTAAPSQLASLKLPASTSQLVSTNPAPNKHSAKARGRKVSAAPDLTVQEKITQFWNGRRDKTGKELEPTLLCHGSADKYQPQLRIQNATATESGFAQYTKEPNEHHPKLSEDLHNQGHPHSELMLYSQVMNQENCETPVYSGQVLVVSYDMKSNWWHKVNIWAFGRDNLARYPDEIAVVITPFHIIFGRIPRTNNIEILKNDWLSLLGLAERTFKTPVVGAEEKTWAYMYRIVPITAAVQKDIDNHEEYLIRSKKFLNDLGVNTVYSKRFSHQAFFVPPVGKSLGNQEFGIRVGRFGKEGQFDRLRVEVRDIVGRRLLRD